MLRNNSQFLCNPCSVFSSHASNFLCTRTHFNNHCKRVIYQLILMEFGMPQVHKWCVLMELWSKLWDQLWVNFSGIVITGNVHRR